MGIGVCAVNFPYIFRSHGGALATPQRRVVGGASAENAAAFLKVSHESALFLGVSVVAAAEKPVKRRRRESEK